MQYAVFQHCIFPLKTFTSIRGQISLVRAVSSCAGLMTASEFLFIIFIITFVYTWFLLKLVNYSLRLNVNDQKLQRTFG